MRLTKLKIIEVPSVLPPLERQQWINRWIEDMQRNGLAILSINFTHDEGMSSFYKVEYVEDVE